MGTVDVQNLHRIYRAATDFSTLVGLPFKFAEDSGHMETAIRIYEDGRYEKPFCTETEEMPSRIFVPDILDFKHMLIVEFEETYRVNRKGHDPDGNDRRTERRDLYYHISRFRVLKIFDFEMCMADETVWKTKLFRFLMDCHENKTECKS